MLKRLTSFFYLRALSREVTAIRAALEAQAAALTRLADHVTGHSGAPPERTVVQAETEVSFADPIDLQLAQDYVERTTRDTGHIPDDDEILVHLGDEKTVDLHRRLAERDAELARLSADRNW